MEINWLASIAAVLASFAVGFIWYHPKVFGTVWMQSIGMTEEKAKQGNMALIFGVTGVMALLASIFLNYCVSHDPMGYSPFVHGAWHGAQTAFFLAMPVIVTNALYEQKNFKNMAVNIGYWLVTFAVMGGILAAWK